MLRKYFVCLILFFLLFTGCSKHGYVNLNYPQAPLAYLPENVQTIAIVNRSLTREEDKRGKVLESIATGEVAGSDRLASDECLKGVMDGIEDLTGIQLIIPQQSRIYGTGTRETPELLDWDLVNEICEANQADVLLVLESFDSNSDLLLSTAANQVNTILSGEVPKPKLPGRIRMNVQSYWRMYDPQTQTIADHFQYTSFMTFDAVNGVPPITALPETAYMAGQDYIHRFLPTYYTVRRNMYKKTKGPGKREFEAGFRRSEVANWTEAIEIWKKLAENGKRKTAGRACLNIAVGYEVLGDTDQALEWAQRS